MRLNPFKRFFTLPLALMALLLLPATAQGAEYVTFTDRGASFVSKSAYTDSDLFGNFKGMMPGDTCTEKITIRNQVRNCSYIKVYMRSLPYDEVLISPNVLARIKNDPRRGTAPPLDYMRGFLSQLTLKIYNGDELVYTGSPDLPTGPENGHGDEPVYKDWPGQPGGPDAGYDPQWRDRNSVRGIKVASRAGQQRRMAFMRASPVRRLALAQPVYLGVIPKGGAIFLNAEITMPLTLGNEYSNRVGQVDWEFMAEIFNGPVPPGGGGSGTGPGDGDSSVPGLKPWSPVSPTEGYPLSPGINPPAPVAEALALLRTGLLNWPVPVLGGLGILLLLCGLFIVTKKREEEENA